MSLPVKTTTVNTTVKEKNPGNVIAEKWQYSVLLGFIYIVLAGESAASLHAESTQTQISFGYSYVYNSRMEKLINCFKKKPDAVVRLICFPWAGGGSIHYARWGSVLNSSIEVFAVKLPGRESRAKEPFFENMQQIVDEVLNLLLPVLKEKPFALFGHSFGAFTSYAVADALKKLENIEPVHIFLSGASAPYSETRIQAPKRSDLSDEDFLKWLISIGGTPPELLANPEVLKVFLPALKADLHVVENYNMESHHNRRFQRQDA
ncbi:S-acyl fatty acid synthase thioesterase, medium chain isoform X2 [Phyllopteryx taeniolatus]|uniref:S-acyl fatty acid synthase thioesterase, medium chain isoform X2 n=1 Tax=Phyllopteryx taeniolatus TaxID=161469 RepID=UPI002AD30C8F|nr:S-acyl fatty acid synthase thioesterase, medium chain isoform X2 [Phyllopteryx taeniolatus]